MSTVHVQARIHIKREAVLPPSAPAPVANLYTVKPDHLTWYWDYKIRDVVRDGTLPSAPAVFRTGEITDIKSFKRSTFSEKWQWFTIDMLSMSIHGVLFSVLTGEDKKVMIKKWGVMYDSGRFLNNRDGVDNRNNYIENAQLTNPLELDPDNDPKIDPLICATSIVEVMEVRNSITRMNRDGKLVSYQKDMAQLSAFDERETPPPVTLDLLNNDPRILTATVIYPDGQVIDFPQFPGQRHPYPLISSGGSERWFPLVDLEKVKTP